MPAKHRGLVVAEILGDGAASPRHHQLEIAGSAPVTLDKHGGAGDIVDGLAVGDQRKWPIPFAGLAVQEPEIKTVRLGSDGRCDPEDRLKIAVHPVALEIALDEGDASRRWSQLIWSRRIAEAPQEMPGKRRIVVITDILPYDLPRRHQQFEIALIAPVSLQYNRITGYTRNRLAIGDQWKWSIPFAGLAIHKPEIKTVRLGSDGRCDPDDRLKIAVHPVALEIALDEGDASRRWSQLIWSRGIPEAPEVEPRPSPVVHVAGKLINQMAAGHQHLEVSRPAPAALDHERIAGRNRRRQPQLDGASPPAFDPPQLRPG